MTCRRGMHALQRTEGAAPPLSVPSHPLQVPSKETNQQLPRTRVWAKTKGVTSFTPSFSRIPSCHSALLVKDVKFDVPRVHPAFRGMYAGHLCRAVSVVDLDGREVGSTLEPIDAVPTHALVAELGKSSVGSNGSMSEKSRRLGTCVAAVGVL